MVTTAELLGRLEGVRGNTARCPAHDDERNSLSIDEGDDGRVLLHCHAGCAFEDVVARIGLEPADLFPGGRGNGRGGFNIAATYDYQDEAGEPLYQVVRLRPKDFRQRRQDGRGGWTWSLRGVRRVLYRLPEVLEAVAFGRTIYIVEGEKDVDRLVGLGLTATTAAGGAGKWRSEYAAPLRDAQVVIIPDNDEPGRAHAEDVARCLHDVAAAVRVVELPGLSEKGDVSDWLDAGGTPEELARLVEAAPRWYTAGPGRIPNWAWQPRRQIAERHSNWGQCGGALGSFVTAATFDAALIASGGLGLALTGVRGGAVATRAGGAAARLAASGAGRLSTAIVSSFALNRATAAAATLSTGLAPGSLAAFYAARVAGELAAAEVATERKSPLQAFAEVTPVVGSVVTLGQTAWNCGRAIVGGR